MKIIFFLPSGVVEYPIPEEVAKTFHFGQVVRNVRMSGFFMGDNLYLNHASIVGMLLQADDGPVPFRKGLN